MLTPSARLIVAALSLLLAGLLSPHTARAQEAASLEIVGLPSKDIEIELTAVPRTVAPGGIVKLVYTISSFEETDERLQLRVETGPGWRVLEAEALEREVLLEADDDIEGELYVTLPADARIGDRHLVRLLVAIAGEAGALRADTWVTVGKRGGAKPGASTIAGSSTIGLSRLGVSGLDDAQRNGALTLSSRLAGHSLVTFAYDRGISENLSNFRYGEARTRVSGSVRHAGWDVTFGNLVPAMGNAVVGPYVHGRGASVRRPSGRWITDVVLTQPNTLSNAAAGHLVRGRVGLRSPSLLLAVAGSDFGRPSGGYTTLAPVQTTVLDPDAAERIDFERQLTAASASNRVRGLGVDAEYRPTRAHTFTLRGGQRSLSNGAGARLAGPALEAAYALSTAPAAFTLRWREGPATLPGISLPGDELAADGHVRLVGGLRLVGRASRNSLATLGRDLSSSSEGASLGLRFARAARRIDVRANVRESKYSRRTERRTVSVSAGTPLGPFVLGGTMDVGQQEDGMRVTPTAFYRTDLRWSGPGGNLWVGATHADNGGVTRQRLDVTASALVQGLELAGGAWATRGYAGGGRPGVWTSVGLPVRLDSMLSIGIDYTPLTWLAEPSLRASVSVRKRFSLPVPFSGLPSP